jgi:hypothetical protein
MTDILTQVNNIVNAADIDANLEQVDWLMNLFTEQFVRQESTYRMTIKKLVQLKEKLVKEREQINGEG